MSEHADPHKMSPDELQACGCERCQDAIRLHDRLDELIASQHKTMAAIARLEETLARGLKP